MKKLKGILLSFALAVICIIGFSATTHAATTLASLKLGTLYKCDVTADGKGDTLKWTRSGPSGTVLNIYINGSRKLQLSGRGFKSVWYYRTTASNEYLLIQRLFAGGASDYVVYHCKSSGLVKLGGLPYAYYTGSLVQSNGEIRYATCPKFGFSSCYLGKLKMCVRVKIANGKMTYASRYAKCYGNYTTYTADNNFYLVTGAGHTKSNGVLVRAGQKVKFQYGYFRDKKIYYRVLVGGKAGWLPAGAKLK